MRAICILPISMAKVSAGASEGSCTTRPDLLEDRAILRTSRGIRRGCSLVWRFPLYWEVSSAAAGGVRERVSCGVGRSACSLSRVDSALNSVLHRIGSRPLNVRDNSRNNWLLGLATWGDGSFFRPGVVPRRRIVLVYSSAPAHRLGLGRHCTDARADRCSLLAVRNGKRTGYGMQAEAESISLSGE